MSRPNQMVTVGPGKERFIGIPTFGESRDQARRARDIAIEAARQAESARKVTSVDLTSGLLTKRRLRIKIAGGTAGLVTLIAAIACEGGEGQEVETTPTQPANSPVATETIAPTPTGVVPTETPAPTPEPTPEATPQITSEMTPFPDVIPEVDPAAQIDKLISEVNAFDGSYINPGTWDVQKSAILDGEYSDESGFPGLYDIREALIAGNIASVREMMSRTTGSIPNTYYPNVFENLTAPLFTASGEDEEAIWISKNPDHEISLYDPERHFLGQRSRLAVSRLELAKDFLILYYNLPE